MRVLILAEIKSSDDNWIVARPLSKNAPKEWRAYSRQAGVSHAPLTHRQGSGADAFYLAQLEIEETTAFADGFL